MACILFVCKRVINQVPKIIGERRYLILWQDGDCNVVQTQQRIKQSLPVLKNLGKTAELVQ